MLDIKHSRTRQRRLLDKMAQAKLDAIVVGLPYHVYYFSTYWTHWLHSSAFILFSDGRSWLASANQPAPNTAADDVVAFEAQWSATLRQEQPHVVADLVAGALKSKGAKRVGIDASPVTSQVARLLDSKLESIDEILWHLRRVKDPDELVLMQEAIGAAAAMYDHARKIVAPGIAWK